ncbi:uncharacterized protein LOC116145058 [Pistacia vera]|uniref:uncharacterized protein LOC116145058 n=1 Tax=Pistacia vera TaxID=55513 RepID=UPI00126327C7|nr:uncharacterized protein LOC116145058 [Pistacia vera]
MEALEPKATQEAINAYRKYMDNVDIVQCIVLASLTPDLQEQHENFSIITHLKELFQKRGRYECYDISKALYRCQMTKGTLVGQHVVKMIGYIHKLEILGFGMEAKLSIDLVLQSLPNSFSQFIMNFNMNSIEKSLSELLNMLKTVEKDMKKSKLVMLVDTTPWKGKGKQGKGNAKGKPKAQPQDVLKPIGGISKDGKDMVLIFALLCRDYDGVDYSVEERWTYKLGMEHVLLHSP